MHVNRDFTAAAMLYDKLLEQGDSTFNTLYSAGMSHSQTGSLERAYDCLSRALEVSQMQHAGCAFRLGVVCVDTKRYSEGLKALELAQELLKPDTTTMKAITLSQGEGFYLTQHYPEAVKAWKRHLDYNPSSVATCYNIANAYAYLIKDEEQAKTYYQRFLELANASSITCSTIWGKCSISSKCSLAAMSSAVSSGDNATRNWAIISPESQTGVT